MTDKLSKAEAEVKHYRDYYKRRSSEIIFHEYVETKALMKVKKRKADEYVLEAISQILTKRDYPRFKATVRHVRYKTASDVPVLTMSQRHPDHPILAKKMITLKGKRYRLVNNVTIGPRVAERIQVNQMRPSIIRKKKNKYGWWDYYVYKQIVEKKRSKHASKKRK